MITLSGKSWELSSWK